MVLAGTIRPMTLTDYQRSGVRPTTRCLKLGKVAAPGLPSTKESEWGA